MSVTMKDIAMLAGVSQQAVSAAFSGKGSSKVSASKREKILKIAAELNYVPNTTAQALAGGQTKAVGIVASLDMGWHQQLVSEICMLLTSRGYKTLTSHCGHSISCATNSLAELVSRGVDGVIILSSESNNELKNRLNLPYVFGSHSNKGGYDVGVNNELTGYLGTRHLLEHGHKKVMFLCVMDNLGNVRIQGWRRAHLEAGIEPDDELILLLRDIDGRIDKLLEFIKKHKISAIFGSNDYVAAKTMYALIRHGIRVPEDIALIGCDGYSFTEFCPVPLTTIIQPIRPQAMAIVDLLLERIENKKIKTELANINIAPHLWTGRSCGCRKEDFTELYRINTLPSLEKNLKLNFNINILED